VNAQLHGVKSRSEISHRPGRRRWFLAPEGPDGRRKTGRLIPALPLSVAKKVIAVLFSKNLIDTKKE
jgi:hypothetical protein